MKTLDKIMFGTLIAIIIFAYVVAIIAMKANAEPEEAEKSFAFQEYMDEQAAEARQAADYSWQQEMIGRVVTFEVGHCCSQCKAYCASACINRMRNWYGGDVIAMITDRNDEYYMMNPDYIWIDEINGANFWEMYEDIMPTIARASAAPLGCYYWDNADSQGEWATLVWHCEADGCWFYK